jgi:hypothetical protein
LKSFIAQLTREHVVDGVVVNVVCHVSSAGVKALLEQA